ncbi:MAG: hypothetical protein CL666_04855 [Balneola sp.]|nr:hypothetical protein [Balneola sp.]|tara:strand:- start:27828 stop:28418 length:591 start_codon:yes stop_codon:yes gene_type:complete
MNRYQFTVLEESEESIRFSILENKNRISRQQFLNELKQSSDFRKRYNDFLAGCDYKAFFWENKPFTKPTMKEGYECNLVKSNLLANVDPDPQTFSSYFEPDSEVVSFPNLGGDAMLVAPCPVSDHSIYTQIGDFVRKAPESQILKFWKMVGEQMTKHVGTEPRWLSTSGLGVYWLHARIDSTPKYYQTEAYKTLGS